MRRVPLDLSEQMGKQTWRWSVLAHDLATARLRPP
jgi:hypothetical protein